MILRTGKPTVWNLILKGIDMNFEQEFKYALKIPQSRTSFISSSHIQTTGLQAPSCAFEDFMTTVYPNKTYLTFKSSINDALSFDWHRLHWIGVKYVQIFRTDKREGGMNNAFPDIKPIECFPEYMRVTGCEGINGYTIFLSIQLCLGKGVCNIPIVDDGKSDFIKWKKDGNLLQLRIVTHYKNLGFLELKDWKEIRDEINKRKQER